MANDREVLREIWEGRLPVCFQLNPDEVFGLRAPDPYYLMVPRLSYFPLVTDKVIVLLLYVKKDAGNRETWAVLTQTLVTRQLKPKQCTYGMVMNVRDENLTTREFYGDMYYLCT